MKLYYPMTLISLVTSCVSTASPKLPEITDAATLDFIVEAVSYDGFATVKGQQSYIMNFKIPEKTQMFAIRTCHREKFFPVDSKQTAIAYKYTPVDGLENTEALCNLTATAITQSGEKLWAYVNFVYPRDRNDANMLKAFMFCDGVVSQHLGGSFCQARAEKEAVLVGGVLAAGSTQKIQLDKPAIYFEAISGKAGNPCIKPKSADKLGLKYEITITPGICVYLFGDKDGAIFRLVTNGYLGKTP